MTREEFEEELPPFKARIELVINKALKEANLKLEDIDDIELMGGALRVPKILEYIQELLGNVNQRLNLDEAASFGAGFLSASLTKSFRVKPTYIALQAPFDVEVKISQEGQVLYEGVLMKKYEECIEPLVINMTTKNSILVELYETIDGNKKKLQIVKGELVNQTDVNTTIEFALTPFGTLKVSKIFSVVPMVVQKNVTVKSNGTDNSTNDETTLIEEIVDTQVSWNMTIDFIPAGRMSVEERKESIKKLDALDEQELAIKKRAIAQNDYESLIYSSREWLTNDENQKYIIEEDKSNLLEVLMKVT